MNYSMRTIAAASNKLFRLQQLLHLIRKSERIRMSG